jgi:DNA modification methylase
MTPWHRCDRATIYNGDCLEVLRALPDASVDAVVTDPPYGLGFMGKEWDDAKRLSSFPPSAAETPNLYPKTGKGPTAVAFDGLGFQSWCQEWAAECLRVLKPGGHLLAFGGTRTWHRLACAIEDAGFEVRDSIAWMYGSGFPKSLDVSKAIDKAAGAERQVIGTHPNSASSLGNGINMSGGKAGDVVDITAPATDAAREWSGWGTALKPAHEPIVVARKPLVGTVAANVLEHGTGALNIDGCRIPSDDGFEKAWDKPVKTNIGAADYVNPDGGAHVVDLSANRPVGGRWPANVVLDEDQAAELDRQSGTFKGRVGRKQTEGKVTFTVGEPINAKRFDAGVEDVGGASRFFYVAKAPARERPKVDGTAHPTVKPLTLMRWLCRLVTPPDGVILEPFAGSGTTIEAALLEGFRVVGIEREADYLPLIQARLDRVAASEPDDEQLTLDRSA